ncbi:hypothetical protein B0F90DRAFT_1218009 [Multifurca ochricompacta]|uniref:Uncharacterized protein n=1 Tax=Multifurca ochricompacta TaxID=376703 RepID=A0AAD4QIH6_9AGAM|nr:hypothetical protein B0F90DRAFT_1218009 [Multifurca ochricompacta]
MHGLDASDFGGARSPASNRFLAWHHSLTLKIPRISFSAKYTYSKWSTYLCTEVVMAGRLCCPLAYFVKMPFLLILFLRIEIKEPHSTASFLALLHASQETLFQKQARELEIKTRFAPSSGATPPLLLPLRRVNLLLYYTPQQRRLASCISSSLDRTSVPLYDFLSWTLSLFLQGPLFPPLLFCGV